MADTLDLIGKLIRLATNNPNEHEAKAAALRACKLLIEHHCIITLPNGAQPRPQPTPRPYHNPWEDLMWQSRKKQAQQKAREAQERRATGRTDWTWFDEQTSRPRNKSHDWDPITEKCRRCTVTRLLYHKMGGTDEKVPCLA